MFVYQGSAVRGVAGFLTPTLIKSTCSPTFVFVYGLLIYPLLVCSASTKVCVCGRAADISAVLHLKLIKLTESKILFLLCIMV